MHTRCSVLLCSWSIATVHAASLLQTLNLSKKPPNFISFPHAFHRMNQGVFLQEVLSPALSTSRNCTTVVGHGAEDFEVWLQVLAESHDAGDVSATVAVVGSRPNCDNILRGEVVLVALVDELMRAGNELQVVDVVELRKSMSVMGGKMMDENTLTSLETLSPNNQPAPLGLTAQVSTSSGSLQTRSQNAPSCGISCALATTLI